jgi:hypothetical protein
MNRIIKTLITVIFISFSLFILPGCKTKPNEPMMIIADYIVPSFTEAVVSADLIVKVEIGKLIKETNDESIPKSFFKAKILESYKNEAGEKTIVVLQDGNKGNLVNNNHIFERGEKYLLFLIAVKNKDNDLGYNAYWIISSEVYAFHIMIP